MGCRRWVRINTILKLLLLILKLNQSTSAKMGLKTKNAIREIQLARMVFYGFTTGLVLKKANPCDRFSY